MTENQYLIPENNLPKLEQKLKKIENKCKKYGCEFFYKIIGDEYKEVKSDDGRRYIVKYIIIEAYGKAIYNGWRFLASIEHTSQGNIIRQADYEISVPVKYQTVDPYCEHCKTDRRRKDTFIVVNVETGEFKQVGKSCLQDFTGGLSANNVADFYSYFNSLKEGQEIGSCGTRYFNKKEMLHYVCECVNKYGYHKTDADYSTARRAFDFFCAGEGMLRRDEEDRIKHEMEKVGFNAGSELVRKETDEALNWIQQNADDTNNYICNLQVVCGLEYVEYKHLGILASLFVAYRKAMDKVIEYKKSESSPSEFVGNLNERITVKLQSFDLIASWETQFGCTYLYKMVDVFGNILIWKASKMVDSSSVASITGSVKEHAEYKNVRQTVLTRCRVA